MHVHNINETPNTKLNRNMFDVNSHENRNLSRIVLGPGTAVALLPPTADLRFWGTENWRSSSPTGPADQPSGKRFECGGSSPVGNSKSNKGLRKQNQPGEEQVKPTKLAPMPKGVAVLSNNKLQIPVASVAGNQYISISLLGLRVPLFLQGHGITRSLTSCGLPFERDQGIGFSCPRHLAPAKTQRPCKRGLNKMGIGAL